eukprot:scaffold2009_cov370-Prasinococcus_capsulatus_cf.AAC.7
MCISRGLLIQWVPHTFDGRVVALSSGALARFEGAGSPARNNRVHVTCRVPSDRSVCGRLPAGKGHVAYILLQGRASSCGSAPRAASARQHVRELLRMVQDTPHGGRNPRGQMRPSWVRPVAASLR